MNPTSRRLPALAIAMLAIAVLVVVARTTPPAATARFADEPMGWMPAAAAASDLTDTWFCPGVPADADADVGGEIVLSNRGDAAITARVAWLGAPGSSIDETLTIEPRSVVALEAGERLTSSFVGAVVEFDGGAGIAEQRARHPAGRPVSPCATDTSSTWYLAEGFTVGGSLNNLVLTNPFDDAAIVNVAFATDDGARIPNLYQGIPVPARSVRVIDLGAPGAGAQGEDRLAVRVESTRGRVVVARAQHFLAGGRLGYTLTLAAPALRDQWWFADGRKGPGISERFSVYNPTDTAVDVDAIFLGIDAIADVEPLEVPARQVVVFDPGQVATLPDGRHATVFSTRADPSIVVERVLTRTDDDGRPISSVVMGAPPAPSGEPVARTWHLVAGPDAPAAEALVVFNPDNAPGTLTVSSVGPDGIAPVPGLEEIEIGPAAIATIDLVADDAIGRELIVSSTGRIFVERSLPSGLGGGRSSSWLVPASP